MGAPALVQVTETEVPVAEAFTPGAARAVALAWAMPAPDALKNADATATNPTAANRNPAKVSSDQMRSLERRRVVTSPSRMAAG